MSHASYTRTQEPYFSQVYAARPEKDQVVRNYLLIDNRDRNPAYPPFSFVINLDEVGQGRYENVVSAQLKTLVFPKILGETYVVVDIEELGDNLDASSNGVHGAFAVAFFDGVDNPDDPPMQPGDRKPIKPLDFHPQVKEFRPPLASLSRLHVSFRKHGGALVDLADVGGVSDVSFLLEIKTLARNLA